MNLHTDIDIDVADRTELLSIIPHVPAIQKDGNTVRKHNTGVYFHDMPTNPLTGNATIDYKMAQDLGYFKIDVLNVSLYKQVKSPEHLDKLCEIEPDWSMLTDPKIVSQLFHLGNHVDVTISKAPKNINQLAMLLALIRPAKKHLIHLPWDQIEKSIWTKSEEDEEGYGYKKSHALGYSMAIVVQMNLLADH